MKEKIIFFAFLVFLTQNIYGQEKVGIDDIMSRGQATPTVPKKILCEDVDDDLFTRLRGDSNRGVDFFNVDGIEITSQKIDAEFSKRNCAKKFPQLKIKEKELTTSDSLLNFQNFYVYKTEERQDYTESAVYYFIESPDNKLIAFHFSYFDKSNSNKRDRDFERKFIYLVANNKIPDCVYNSAGTARVNFAGRELCLGGYCRWMGINNIQCPSYGQMNWSVHKTLEDAQTTIDNYFATLTLKRGGKIVSDTIVDVIFENVETTARKVVYNFTGAKSLLLKMEGSNSLTIYYVAAPVRNNFVSCIMSFWASDQINPSGLPPLLEEVMKLK